VAVLTFRVGGSVNPTLRTEFGAIAIDDDMVVRHEQVDGEEIFYTTNGCLCCNVREDLVPVLARLYEADMEEPLDGIIVETTGLANPSPVIQTFTRDPTASMFTKMDAVVTLVDAAHCRQHFQAKSTEFVNQIQFADRILLNKTDLVTAEVLISIEQTRVGCYV
jgi:G3E family GTPase